MDKASLNKCAGNHPPDWQTAPAPVDYNAAVSFMEEKVAAIHAKGENDLIWLLEHPPLYTAGTSAQAQDLLNPRFPVYPTGRGGQYTYHGPGQRVAYVMRDLKRRTAAPDLRLYIFNLEEWIIRTLAVFHITGERREGRVGIWVVMPDGREAKIAAIGVRVRKWVAYHGIAINLNPDLSHFEGIVPCGLKEYGVTSLKQLGVNITMAELDAALRQEWGNVFDV
jgi:lipoyl(octanoyl) transferase